MNLYRIAQSILLALVVIGLFAAMARNAYGFTFIGVACLGLAALYFMQALAIVIADFSLLKFKTATGLFELFLLGLLLALFGLRAFYIYLPASEFIFSGVCILLSLLYLFLARINFKETLDESRGLAFNLFFLNVSIVFFLLSMAIRVYTSWSLMAGALGMLTALPFIFSVLKKQQFEIKDKVVTLFQVVSASKSKLGLLFLFFICSAFYMGLTQFGYIPEIENADRPSAYIELINNAESGKEKPVDGRYRHEIYKESMGKFLERHGGRN